MNRTDRLYALVEELRAVAPRPRSARQLAGRYEVSTRTIERDILALQESGVPIYAEPGRRGGYVIDASRTLPPVNFTAPELVAMAVALARQEATPFAAATRSALRKVLAAAPAAQAAEAARLMNRVRLIDIHHPGARVPRPAARPAADGRAGASAGPGASVAGGAAPAAGAGAPELGAREAGVPAARAGAPGANAWPAAGRAGAPRPGRAAAGHGLQAGTRPARERAAERWRGAQPATEVPLAIQEAITAGHLLRLDYQDRNGRVTVREVEPVAFAATRSQWYLMGWCRLRDAGRAFRLDRVLAAADTGQPVPPRSYADLGVDIPDALVRQPELSS
jgi:predicted DNA-binding transcriptional regulator YafY